MFRLSSYQVLNRSKDFRSLGLPIGLLVSPFQSLQGTIGVDHEGPAAATEANQVGPGSDVAGSPNGSTGYTHGSDPSAWYLRRTCLRCTKCSAALNRYCSVTLETGEWQCVICNHTNINRTELSDGNIHSYPELAHKVIEYIEPRVATNPTTPVESFLSQQNPVYVFVLDELIAFKELGALHNAILNTLKRLPRNAFVSVVTYSNVVSVYQVNSKDLIAAQVFSGTATLGQADKDMLKKNLIHFSSALDYCQDNISSILRVFSKNRVETKTRGRTTTPQQSCLGTAIQVATSLLEAHGLESGLSQHQTKRNVLVFLSRAPNLGPGAIPRGPNVTPEMEREVEKFYQDRSTALYNLGARADLFCIGNQQVGVTQLKNLTRPCGGYLFVYKYVAAELESDLYNSLTRPIGRGGKISIQTSSELSLSRMVAPVVALDSHHLRKSSFLVPTIDPQQFYSAHFDLIDDIPADAIYIQMDMQYTNPQNELVTRIATFSVATTGNKETFISSIDSEAMAILLSRLEIVHSRSCVGDSAKINNHVDATLRRIIKGCGNLKSPPSFGLPPTLRDLPFRLFHLRRGPLLGVMLQHADDIEMVQGQFLYASPETSRKHIQPQLFEAVARGEQGQAQPQLGFRELPLEDLVLRSNRVILFDDETNIYVWSGSEAVGPQFDLLRAACLSWAGHLSETRFPRPVVMSFKEGESMARFLSCRLSVLHKDQPAEQDLILPELKTLSPEERRKLVSRFIRSDEFSFLEYCRWLSSEKTA